MKIRIAIYYSRIKNGGIERSTSMFINYFHKIKIFKIYLFTIKNREEDEYIIPKSIKRIIVDGGKISNLIKELKKKKINILIYQFYDAYSIKQLNKLNKTKTIIYNHSSIFYWINIKFFSIFNQTYQEYINSKYVISLVPLENDYIFKKWGINSILMDNFMTYEYELISPSNLFSNNILMLGRADDKNKRFDLCFKAFEYILQYIPDCKINIMSSINNTLFLQNLACNLNLENNIEFLGYISQPQIFFKNASLHILPSIGESFSMALCETKIFGIPNILIGLEYLSASSGGTVIIFDDSSELLAKESINLLKDNKYKKFIGKQARLSMKKFNNSLLLGRWIKLILSIYNNNYQKMIQDDIKISNSKAINILKNEVNLIKKRNQKLNNITINEILNISYLKNLK